MSHTRDALCHSTHIIPYIVQLLRYLTACIRLQTSHTSSVFHLEDLVRAVDTICVPVLVFVYFYLKECISVPMYMNVRACLPTGMLVPQTKELIGLCGKKQYLKRRVPGSYQSVV